MENIKRSKKLLDILFIAVLVFYPLRHINWGLDLWDTGYNYANFQYMGTEHMDSMWLFSTYLSNVVGHLLMKLPYADNLMGMNFYTGLFVSLSAVTGYIFCTRSLKMPAWISFTGEFIAVSLCWCPTAVLYNYLTYVFMLSSVILLYQGLTKEKNICLVLAGICLGANVLVRFSNLPEAVLILAVWIYDILVWRRGKKETVSVSDEKLWRRLGMHTFWCFIGYALSLLVSFGYIHIRYGITNYVAGIQRLFAMTSDNTDYKPDAMFMGVIESYGENMYWVIRIGVILTVGIAFFAVADWLLQICGKREWLCWWCSRILLASIGSAALAWLCMKYFYSSESMMSSFTDYEVLFHPAVLFVMMLPMGVLLSALVGYPLQKRFGTDKAFGWEIRVLWMAVCVAMLVWLYMKEFCTTDFLRNERISYGPMLQPAILFLMLAMLSGVICIGNKNSSESEKLISVMVILVVLVTSLGSNNRLFPSINNLFLAAPFTLWHSWRFCRNTKVSHVGRMTFHAFPAKGILAAFVGMCLFQFAGFGATFAFAEASGVYNITASVENNKVLKNMKMSPEKAQWLTELSGYVNEHELQGREVILYGFVPSLAYYLQMPPAFNSWSDLASYNYDIMAETLEETEIQMWEGRTEPPVVLVDYLQGGLNEGGKWGLIKCFMERNGYELVWQNDRFAFYEAAEQES